MSNCKALLSAKLKVTLFCDIKLGKNICTGNKYFIAGLHLHIELIEPVKVTIWSKRVLYYLKMDRQHPLMAKGIIAQINWQHASSVQ